MTAAGELPRLHLVTDDRVVEGGRFAERAAELLEIGGPHLALHLRAPRASGRRLYDLARRLEAPARRHGALLIVNDRVDVALAAGAAGVQVGARGVPADRVRRLLGPERWLGVSVHSTAEAVAALAAGADFLLAGTVYESASHPGRVGAGPGWLRKVAGCGGRVVAIGGIEEPRVPEVVRAGAWGVAVIRAVWAAERPGGALLRLIDALYRRGRIDDRFD